MKVSSSCVCLCACACVCVTAGAKVHVCECVCVCVCLSVCVVLLQSIHLCMHANVHTFIIASSSILPVDFWLGTLRNKEVVWMSSTSCFVSVLKMAFSAAYRGIRMEPYLYTVPTDMLPYAPLLRAFGVRERCVCLCPRYDLLHSTVIELL